MVKKNPRESSQENAADWLAHQFLYENCAECFGGIEHHTAILFNGNWFARCNMEFKAISTHDPDRMNLCDEHAKGLIFLVTGFGWNQYRTRSEGDHGWYNGCDYGRNAPGVVCNLPAEYLYERGK